MIPNNTENRVKDLKEQGFSTIEAVDIVRDEQDARAEAKTPWEDDHEEMMEEMRDQE